MGFELVESSVLQVFKGPIPELAGLADHYYLAETSNPHHSVGWGASGLELRSSVRITSLELERVERFMAAAKYSIAVNNCEHFANYILHGINLSSQGVAERVMLALAQWRDEMSTMSLHSHG
jgi:hypothetical protein